MSVSITSRNLVFEPVNESMILRASTYKGFEQSFFSEALSYSAEAKAEIRVCSKQLYKTIAEATSEEVVNEGFSEFGKKVKDIIGKFIDFLKKLFARFITLLNKIVQSDKYIKKNKELFSKFTDKDSFTVERYNYTYLDNPSYPNTSTLTDFDTELQALTANFNDIVAGSNVDLQLDKFYDTFRFTVLHPEDAAPKGTISQDRYAKALNDLFRDGGVKRSVRVDSTLVTYAYTRFADHERTVKSIKTVKQDLEDQYNKIKHSMEGVLSVDTDKATLNNATEYQLGANKNKFQTASKQYVDKITQMTQIHAMAFSAKLDAVAECFKADKELLYKALNKIQGFKHESVSELGCDDGEDDPYKDLVGESVRLKAGSMFGQLTPLIEYSDFLLSESAAQNEMIRYINHEILAGTGTRISSYTEAGNVGAKIKNTINRIVTLISQVFAKFVEFMNKVFKNDQKYLERYKTIILQKKLAQAEIKMNDYVGNGAFKFLQLQIVQYMDNSTQKEVKYADEYYKLMNIQVHQNEDKTLKEYVMEKFVGEAVDIDTAKINMTDVYNYIYSFDKLKDSIAKDLKTLDNESNKINGILNKHSVDVDAAEKAKADEAAAAKGTKDQGGETSAEESFTFESTMRRYFSEEFSAKSPGSDSNAKVSSSTATTPNQDKAIGNNANSTTETKDQAKARVGAMADKINGVEDSETLSTLEEGVRDYYSATRDFLVCKMEVAKMIYNDYFKLIRWHVRNNVGQGENDTDKSTTKGTDYSKDQPHGQAGDKADADKETGGDGKDDRNFIQKIGDGAKAILNGG